MIYNYTAKNLINTAKILGLSILLGALSSCQESTGTQKHSKLDETAVNIKPISSVLHMFSCKPPNSAFVAAHRGTHEKSNYPENALDSLKALHEKGVLFAEVDVARLKDGTQILYHDGTWNRGSTGTGPIAASSWEQSQKFLLKDTNGNITSYRPSAFSKVLSWAKGKIYLEIDFKSSANEAKVIAALRSAKMLSQVILISYNTEQALRLHKLAPRAALSVGIFKPGDIKALEARGIPANVMTAWTGKGPLTLQLAQALRARKIPILAASFFSLDDKLQTSKDFSLYTEFARLPDLVVTNYAFDAQQVLEIKGKNLNSFNNCISKAR